VKIGNKLLTNIIYIDMKKSVLAVFTIFEVMTISAENVTDLFPNIPLGGRVTSTFINIEDGDGKITQYNLSDYAAYLMREKVLDENLNSTENSESDNRAGNNMLIVSENATAQAVR
jgi:hypothetical protein